MNDKKTKVKRVTRGRRGAAMPSPKVIPDAKKEESRKACRGERGRAVHERNARLDAYRLAAQRQYGCDDVQVDEDARVSLSDTGGWVQVWVWVYDERSEDETLP